MNFNLDNELLDDLDLLKQSISKPFVKTYRLQAGERRNAAVLFLDIQKFTNLSERLDPEDVKNIVFYVFGIFRKIINKYNGIVNKYEGDQIMAVFGSKKSSEKDAEFAIRAGIEILSKLSSINRILKSKDVEVNIRIGVNYGFMVTVVMERSDIKDETVLSDAVNVGARLQSAAPINRILTSYETARLVEDTFHFTDMGEISVKGKSKPIRVALIEGLKSQKIERWQRSRLKKVPNYYGREDKFKKLSNIFRSVSGQIEARKKSNFIHIIGEPGLGKSRFVYEFFRKYKSLTDKSYRLTGHTVAFKTQSFYSIKEMISGFFEFPEKGDRKLYYERKIEKWNTQIDDKFKHLLGYLAGIKYDDPVFDLNGEQIILELKIAFTYFIDILAERQNVIITLDDMQWADELTIEFIIFLLENSQSRHPLIFIGISRNDHIIPSSIMKNSILTTLQFFPLNSKNCDLVISSMIGSVTKELSQLLFEKSGGNPFFIEELILMLLEKKLLVVNEGGYELLSDQQNISIPKDIQSIIIARLDFLSLPEKEILEIIAIVGEKCSLKMSNYIYDQIENKEKKDLSSLLDKLINKNLLRLEMENEESIYVFKHALIQQITYNLILNENKKLLHKLTAEAIEHIYENELEDHYGDLGHNYWKANIIEKAEFYLQKAGKNSQKQYHNEEAIQYFEHLIEITTDFDKMIRTYLNLGDLNFLIGKWDKAKEHYENALKNSKYSQNHIHTAKSYNKYAYFHIYRGNYDQATEYAEKAKSIYEKINDAAGYCHSLENIGLIAFRRNQYKKALSYFLEYLKLTEEIKDNILISNALGYIGNIYRSLGNYEKSLQVHQKKLKMVKDASNQKGVMETIGDIGNIYYHQGDYENALNSFLEKLQIAEKLGDRKGISSALGNIGVIYQIRKNYDKAMIYYEKDMKMCSSMGEKRAVAICSGNLGYIYQKKGDYVQAKEFYLKKLEISNEIRDKRGIGFAYGRLGNLYLESKKLESAEKSFLLALRNFSDIGFKKGISTALGSLGELYLISNDLDKAKEYFIQKLSLSRETGNKMSIGLALNKLAQIHVKQKNYKEAMDKFDRAIDIFSEIKLNSYLKDVLYLKAELYLEMNDPENAEKILSDMEQNFEQAAGKEDLFKIDLLKARIFFVARRKDEALKLLTEMNNKYTDKKQKKNISDLFQTIKSDNI